MRRKARVKWLNEGNHNSRYFHRVLKGRQAKLRISSLQNDEGVTLTDEGAILSEFIQFYANFFEVANSDCNGGTDVFFHYLGLSTLTSAMHSSLLATVTSDEVFTTLKSMPRNKTPSPDGYTVEFFLSCWTVVGFLVTKVVKEFFTSGCLLK